VDEFKKERVRVFIIFNLAYAQFAPPEPEALGIIGGLALNAQPGVVNELLGTAELSSVVVKVVVVIVPVAAPVRRLSYQPMGGDARRTRFDDLAERPLRLPHLSRR
jgi:hypothetical protein